MGEKFCAQHFSPIISLSSKINTSPPFLSTESSSGHPQVLYSYKYSAPLYTVLHRNAVWSKTIAICNISKQKTWITHRNWYFSHSCFKSQCTATTTVYYLFNLLRLLHLLFDTDAAAVTSAAAAAAITAAASTAFTLVDHCSGCGTAVSLVNCCTGCGSDAKLALLSSLFEPCTQSLQIACTPKKCFGTKLRKSSRMWNDCCHHLCVPSEFGRQNMVLLNNAAQHRIMKVVNVFLIARHLLSQYVAQRHVTCTAPPISILWLFLILLTNKATLCISLSASLPITWASFFSIFICYPLHWLLHYSISCLKWNHWSWIHLTVILHRWLLQSSANQVCHRSYSEEVRPLVIDIDPFKRLPSTGIVSIPSMQVHHTHSNYRPCQPEPWTLCRPAVFEPKDSLPVLVVVVN